LLGIKQLNQNFPFLSNVSLKCEDVWKASIKGFFVLFTFVLINWFLKERLFVHNKVGFIPMSKAFPYLATNLQLTLTCGHLCLFIFFLFILQL
jgi:hypothetical protein